MSYYYGKVIYAERYKANDNPFITFMVQPMQNTGSGMYRHYGIGYSNDQVIHFQGEPGNASNARVKITSMKEFAKGDEVNECSRISYSYSQEEVVSRALSKVGSNLGGYHLTNNNCEHFTTWCANGNSYSNQVPFNEKGKDIVEKTLDNFFDPLIKAEKDFKRSIENIEKFFKRY